MALKKPRKPKLKSLPKKPKNKTLSNMENWNKRAKQVQSDNNKKVAEYNKELSAYEADKKRLDKLKDGVDKHTVKFKD